jgi:hypothetical protein
MAVVLVAIIASAVATPLCYFFSQYHQVDHQRYYQVTSKFWKDDNGIIHTGTPSVWSTVDGYWYHLKGYKSLLIGNDQYEADSKKEWDAMSVGSYVLVEWQTWDRYVR